MATFTNATGVTIPSKGDFLASQTVNVTGLTGPVATVTLTFTGLAHSFADDLEFLLVAPDGTTNLLLWSDVGPNGAISGNFTVSDTGATILPLNAALPPGTYRPANQIGPGAEALETGADFGKAGLTLNHATGSGGSATFASVFSGYATPNGTWTLYIRDDTDGDAGSLTSWSLDITSGSVSVIGDKVFEDLDGDGIQDIGEPGVDGVTVQLLDTGNSVVATTTTASGGLYSFTNVSDGTYSIKFITPGGTNYTFTTKDQGGNDALDSDVNASGQTGQFAVSGSNITHIDAGLKGTHIVSQVFGDLDRDGIQDAGETGVDGVTVKLLNSSGGVVTTATTANGGMYDFANVTPGTYSLEFSTPTGFAFSPKDAGGDDTLDSDANASNPNIGRTDKFTVALGQTLQTVDAGMYATAGFGTYTFTNKAGATFPAAGANQTVQTLTLGGISGPVATVKVFINGLTHQLLDDMDFWLVGPDGTSNLLFWSDVGGNTGGSSLNIVVADSGGAMPDGSGLASGTYRPTDYTTAGEGAENAASFGAGGPTLSHAAPVGSGTFASTFTGLDPNGTWTLYARDDSGGDAGSFTSWGIEVTTASVSVIGDKVFEDLDGDGVQDVGEPGVDGITVQLLDTGNSVVATTTTASGGLYSFTNVVDGTYSLKFVIPGGANYAFTAKDQGGNDALDSDVNSSGQTAQFAVSGSNITNVDAGLLGTHIGNRVFGDLDRDGVQDAGEAGLDGVTVKLLNSADTVVATTTTANGGLYDFANVTPGTYSVKVDLPSQFSFSPQDAVTATDLTDSDVNPTTGQSGKFNIALGQTVSDVDAGVYATNGVGTFTFTNKTGVTFQTATPQVTAQTFSVGGVAGGISQIKINVNGLSHNLPDDLDFLLVGPDGTSNLLFWSDAGGVTPGGPFNIVIADSGASGLPDAGGLSSGTFRPTNHTTGGEGLETAANFNASGFTVNHAAGAGSATLLSAFENLSPNGVWTLYLRDDASGDGGSLTSWSLEITTVLLNTPPTANATSGSGAEDGPRIAIALSGSDVDSGDAIESFSIATLAANGQLFAASTGGSALAAGAVIPASGNAATVYFQPNANYNGSTSFTYTAFDGDENGAAATASITVTAVDDAPSGADGSVAAVEDTTLTLSASAFGFTDPDGDLLLNVKINTLPTGGTLFLDTDGAGGSAPVAITAGQSIARTEFDAGHVTYVPTANVNGKHSLTFQVQDDSGAVGFDTDATANTLTINVAAVNDAPVVSGDGTEAAATILEDQPSTTGQTVSALFGGQYSDVADNQLAHSGGSSQGAFSGIAVVANGSSGATGQWQYFNTTTSAWVNVGAVSTASALLIGAGTALRFNPAAEFAGAAPTLTAHLIDNSLGFGITFGQTADLSGVGATGGATAYSTGTVVLSQTVTAVDDLPAFVGLDNTPTYTEGGARVVLDGDATVSDVDTPAFAGTTLTLVRQGGANGDDSFDGSGTLELTDGQVYLQEGGPGGPVIVGSYANADGTLAITFNADATQARVNAVLQQITYANGGEPPSGPIVIGYTFDNGQQATGSITVGIVATPDPPDVEGVTPSATFTPGGVAVLLGADITITDVDSTTLTGATVTISNAQAGDVLSANAGATGLAVSYLNGVLTVSGPATLAQYQQVLATVAFSSSSSDPQIRNVSWVVDDGAATSAPESTNVYFAPAVDLDASGAGTGFSTTFVENGAPVAIVDTDVVVSDGSFGVSSARVVLTNAQANDALTVGALPGGITATVDTSTPGQITVDLSGAASAGAYATALAAIRFAAGGDDPAAVARTITVTLGDSNGFGGAAVATVAVTTVNDAPSGSDGSATFLEDTVYTLGVADFGFTDVDGNALSAVVITTPPAIGVLSLNGGAVGAGQVVSAADIVAGLLKYTPPANANGPALAGFTFQVRDNGGVANGGVDTDPTPNSFTFNVTPESVPPSGADAAIAVNEDTPYTLARADFGFSDANTPPNAFVSVIISAVPAAGVLRLNGVAVSVGQEISTADIDAGRLVYTPPAEASGAGLASLSFQVRDNGQAGLNLDLTPNTLTFNVASVNDAPSGADGFTLFQPGTLFLTTYTLTTGDFGFSDPDGNSFQSVVIVAPPASGLLSLNGAAVSAGQVVLVSDIAAGLLKYAPPVDATGADLGYLTFQVRDDGGTANGGVDTDPTPNRFSFILNLPDDRPPEGADRAIGLAENTAYALKGSDFGFSDSNLPPDGFVSVLIASLPTVGTLKLNGVAVSAGQEISVADIDAGRLVYTPPTNAAGPGLARFTFQVRDDGAAGLNLDPTPNTLTFNVAPGNDAPVITLAGGPIAVVGPAPVAVNPGLTLADPDSPTLASASVAITGGFVAGEDVLAFTSGATTGNITASYDAAGGVLTLTSSGATATLAQWQAALRAVTYDSTAPAPTAADRTVTFTVSDGTAVSAPVSQVLDLDGLTTLDRLELAFQAILRINPDGPDLNPPTAAEAAQLAGLAAQVNTGAITLAQAYQVIAGFADDTTSVATLAYQFFTGLTPTQAGYDYLVAGPANANDLNDPYYAPFNLVNRYINFAVNLGAAGEGKAAFQAEYGALTLAQAMQKAYVEIIGFDPGTAKIAQILDADVGGITRAQYLAYYGGDGLNGLGTKAAAVGFLLSVAVLEAIGPYNTANDNFLADLSDGNAGFNLDLLDAYLNSSSPVALTGMASHVDFDAGGIG